MRVLSRSSHERYNTCPRSFYYTFEYQGTGLEPRVTPIHLAVGLAVHKGLEVALTLGGSTGVAGALEEWARVSLGHLPELVEEGAALIPALLLAWGKVRRPTFEAELDVISVEKEG